MNWKLKAFIQNFISILPRKTSNEIYFRIQRSFGELKRPFSPINRFLTGVYILKKIKQYGKDFRGKIFFEVGTGRIPLLPIAFWLCGAEKIITIDINPYMREELIKDIMLYIEKKESEIRNIFGLLLYEKRFISLLNMYRKNNIKKEILELCQIEYLSPADAAKTTLPDNSIDYHVSNAVYEHIPFQIIKNILQEGNRIISEDGLFINIIDYTDHFYKSDKKISVINFLKYNEKEWSKYTGNQYMYMNRARHDDFLELFKSVGHNFLEVEPYINKEVEKILDNNEVLLDSQFKNKNKNILSITGSLFITRKSKIYNIL